MKRRKPFSYKQNKFVKIPKTSRKEMHPITRAFVVGAIVASRDGYASAKALSTHLPHTQEGMSALVSRVEARAKDGAFDLWDPILYETEIGRGRPELLTEEQKLAIIAITTSDRNHREQESWQAIAHGDFTGIIEKLSISTFENVMYEAGYSRKRPGWKPPLSPSQARDRFAWAQRYNPDKYEVGDGLGFDFRIVVFTDETPARIGEQRGMLRTWRKEDEAYHDNVRKDRNRRDCCLQFFGAFRYDYKGPCHVYYRETAEEKELADATIEQENLEIRTSSNRMQTRARKALQEMNELDINLRNSTRKLQHIKKHDYHRGIKSKGGVDGFRHREGALKSVVPWVKTLKNSGVSCLLLEDGAPPHKSRIANDFLHVNEVEKMLWPGHSPDVNASEHAWPWIRRHITRSHKSSCNEAQCELHWRYEWDQMPQEVINKWVIGIPRVVRLILAHGGKNDFPG